MKFPQLFSTHYCTFMGCKCCNSNLLNKFMIITKTAVRARQRHIGCLFSAQWLSTVSARVCCSDKGQLYCTATSIKRQRITFGVSYQRTPLQTGKTAFIIWGLFIYCIMINKLCSHVCITISLSHTHTHMQAQMHISALQQVTTANVDFNCQSQRNSLLFIICLVTYKCVHLISEQCESSRGTRQQISLLTTVLSYSVQFMLYTDQLWLSDIQLSR